MNSELNSVRDHLRFDQNLQIWPENFELAVRVEGPSLVAVDSRVTAEKQNV
jgi:hypothetical protein